jgi:benzoylformate decarboxylase
MLPNKPHLATTPPMGPVFVSLPMDDMQAELDNTQAADIAAVHDRKVIQAVGFPADLADQICARIEAATSPALIVGGDVERYGAWDAVIGLAERTQSIVWAAPPTGWSGFPENLVIVQVSESQAESQAMQVNHRRRNYRNGSRISLVTARKFDWIAGS